MSYVTELKVSVLGSSAWQEGLPGSDWQVVRNASDAQDFKKGVSGKYIYIYYRLGDTGPGLTALRMIKGQDAPAPEGWQKISQNLNAGTEGEHIYLCYQSTPDALKIAALKASEGGTADSAMAGFTKDVIVISQDTNEGAQGEYIYLGYTLETDIHREEIKLPAGSIPNRIAIASDGTAWVVNAEWGNGQVFSIGPDDSNVVTHTLPKIAKMSRLTDIALQTDDNGKVKAVWVSSSYENCIYRLEPAHSGQSDQSKKIEVGPAFNPSAIGWDQWRKLLWIVSDGPRSCSFNPETGKVEQIFDWHLNDGDVGGDTTVLVLPQAVWFSEEYEGGVRVLENGSLRKISFRTGGERDVNVAGFIIEGSRIFAVGQLYGGVLGIADLSSGERRQIKLEGGLGIAADKTGHLWIIFNAQVSQFTKDGQVVENIPIEHAELEHIAYSPSHDQIWISDFGALDGDQRKPSRIIRLTLGKGKGVSIEAAPKSAPAAAGDRFTQITLTVKKGGKPVGKDVDVTLTIDAPDKATFAGGKSSLPVKTDENGQIFITNLTAVTTAKKGETFNITAMTAGLEKPVPIFTGTIGEAVANITGIHAVGDKEESVLVGKAFQNSLQVKVEGTGAGKTGVTFKITKGSDSAAFVEGNGKSEYTVTTDGSGVAEAHLKALQVPGTVQVEAYPVANASKKVSFQKREVKPLPISITATPDQGTAVKGHPFPKFTVAVNENGKPVGEGKEVTLTIEPSSKASFADGQSHITVKTNAQGKAVVDTLKAAAGAANGDQFTVKATTHGLTTAVSIYTGHIGEEQVPPKDVWKPIRLPADVQAIGVAVAADGTAWVAGRLVDAKGQPVRGQVFSIARGGGAPTAYKLPAPDSARPEYVALQTAQDNHTVEAVWVSDLGTRYVYRLTPGDQGAHNAVKVDLGERSETRGIAWDQHRKRIWVADEVGERLVAIDPKANAVDKTWTRLLPKSKIQMVAVTEKGVWFTQFGTGKVCFLDASTKEKDVWEVGFGLGERDSEQYPYGIAVHGNRLWVTASLRDELWAINDITNLQAARLEKVTSFADHTQPDDIVVDTAGYLWVTLTGTNQVVQLTDTGRVVQTYDLPDKGSPRGLAYAAGQDQIWIANRKPDHNNHTVYLLTPIDKIAPARNKQVLVKADPDSGNVASKGNPFRKWTLRATENGKPVERHVVLAIEPKIKASFAGNQSSVVAKTDAKTGEFVVETLKAAVDAGEKDSFEITATTRGFEKPVPIYTGHIGEADVHITGMTAIHDEREVTTLGTPFSRVLQVKLEGTGVSDAKVIFKITKGKESAAFAQGERGASEYTAITNGQGIALAVLQALGVPGTVQVTAQAADASKTVAFKDRLVVPVPDKIAPDPKDTTRTGMIIRVGEPSKRYTIKVTGTYDGREYPVPNARIEVRIALVHPGARDVHFVKAGEPAKKQPSIFILANEQGEASIGDGTEWYILSSDGGRVTVRFTVTDPTTKDGRPVELTLNPTVTESSL